LDSDDEVAVAVNPDNRFCATSVALIHVRYAMWKATVPPVKDAAIRCWSFNRWCR